LTVGDTGKLPPLTHHFHKERAVGLGIAAEDRRQPADALLLLGDNFYWDGLKADEIVGRVRANVVRPFCRFVDLSGPRSGEVDDACSLPEGERRPIPIYALLGNHDYKDPDSPELQRQELPRFVPNWRTSDGLAELIEFPAGVSLVLVDSVLLLLDADPAPLLEALRRSRGPWRILAMHHPLTAARDMGSAGAAAHAAYRARILDVIAEAGVEVHLALAGHEHNLQLIEMEPPAPPLQVVSGSGSRVRALRTTNPNTRFAAAALGFARIDLVGTGSDERLVVSLFATARLPFLQADSPRPVARWSVSRDRQAQDALSPAIQARSSTHAPR
jgi:hypothetical protein